MSRYILLHWWTMCLGNTKFDMLHYMCPQAFWAKFFQALAEMKCSAELVGAAWQNKQNQSRDLENLNLTS